MQGSVRGIGSRPCEAQHARFRVRGLRVRGFEIQIGLGSIPRYGGASRNTLEVAVVTSSRTGFGFLGRRYGVSGFMFRVLGLGFKVWLVGVY